MKTVGVFLHIRPDDGGAFQYCQAVLEALHALPSAEYRVVVAYTDPGWSAHLGRYSFRHLPLKVGYWGARLGVVFALVRFPISWWRRHLCRLNRAVRTISDAGCDLWLFPSQDSFAYLAPVPAIATIHDLMHRYERRFPESGSLREYLWRERNYRMICRYSRAVLVDSVVGKGMVQECYGVSDQKIGVLPYVSPSYLRENLSERPKEQFPELPPKFFFYPAQFWQHKNHRRLFEAVARLKSELPDIRLICAGSPKNGYDEACRVRKALGLEEQVELLGYVPESAMSALYEKARALIFPSFYGPTNIPPLEAMAMGCPMAVSKVYAMPEQVGDAALLFDPLSVEEMTHVMRRLWLDDDLCRRLAERGRAKSAGYGMREFSSRLRQIIDAAAAPVGTRIDLESEAPLKLNGRG